MAGNTKIDARRDGRWSLVIWGGAAGLLLIPLVAMRFTSEVVWGPEDFAVMGVMLALVCGGLELVTRARGGLAYRIGATVAIVTAFLLVWANLAVGFIGNEDNPINLVFGGVLAIALVGVIIAGFKPRGMALAMLAVATAQAAVAVFGLALGIDVPIIGTAIFVALWLGSAWLFAIAARQQTGTGV